jgi:hypothetical protein
VNFCLGMTGRNSTDTSLGMCHPFRHCAGSLPPRVEPHRSIGMGLDALIWNLTISEPNVDPRERTFQIGFCHNSGPRARYLNWSNIFQVIWSISFQESLPLSPWSPNVQLIVPTVSTCPLPFAKIPIVAATP